MVSACNLICPVAASSAASRGRSVRSGRCSMHSDEPLFGMPPEALYVWGTLRDDEGDLHTIMRRIPHNGAASSRRRLVVQTTMGGAEGLRMHPCGRDSAPHTDPIRELIDDDTIEWRSNPEVKGAPFRLRWANETCEWVEEGVLDLTGTLSGRACSGACPVRGRRWPTSRRSTCSTGRFSGGRAAG